MKREAGLRVRSWWTMLHRRLHFHHVELTAPTLIRVLADCLIRTECPHARGGLSFPTVALSDFTVRQHIGRQTPLPFRCFVVPKELLKDWLKRGFCLDELL